MTSRDLDRHDADAPIFEPAAFRLADDESALIGRARRFGARVLAPRAAQHDRDATFPIETFRDMHGEGLLGICIPEEDGGLGAGYRTYCLAAAELGRYCGATALSWNMHVSSTLWTGALADDLEMTAAERAEHKARRSLHYKRIVGDGAIYSQPFSEGGAAAAGVVAFGTEAKPVDGGFLVSGKKIFASLSGAADYYGVLCTERGAGDSASRRNTLYLAIAADAEGVSVVGDWDPLGMRGTVSRTLLFKDVFVAENEMLMPRGVYFRAATSWPRICFSRCRRPHGAGAGDTISPSPICAASCEHAPSAALVPRQKQIAVAEDARDAGADQGAVVPRPSAGRAPIRREEQVLRATPPSTRSWRTPMRSAAKAIRTCGGRSHAENPGAGTHLATAAAAR
jgi:hypothetical protein